MPCQTNCQSDLGLARHRKSKSFSHQNVGSVEPIGMSSISLLPTASAFSLLALSCNSVYPLAFKPPAPSAILAWHVACLRQCRLAGRREGANIDGETQGLALKAVATLLMTGLALSVSGNQGYR